ncbi:MAG TPA: pyruvate, phosphate dikinase [Longimicrobiales bacterium]|nr:pyruvate, phosphate dikinase [Longimicrobiales bacterium]
MSRYVYLFSDLDDAQASVGGDWQAVRRLLGGKGANLADMTRLGIPVPPGFTVTTEACLLFQEGDGTLPDEIWRQSLAAVKGLEAQIGRGFGDPSGTLLVSCRSGAAVSMPGMMDTVLNIGLNDEIAEAAISRGRTPRFVYDLYRRLVHMFGNVVLGVSDEVFERVLDDRRRLRGVADDTGLQAEDWEAITEEFKKRVRSYAGREFPQDPYEQLQLATTAVFRSWDSARARDYRRAAGIPDDLGTAVNVQTMVYGNVGEGSATGVCMSRNATTGVPELEGDYLANAQGEDVVAGNRATRRIREMADDMPEIYQQLCETAEKLERHYRNMQDMEFTVEEGTLWLLQTRDGKRTAQAEVRIAVDQALEGLITREEAVQRVKPEQVDFFLHPQLRPELVANAVELARGLNVSPGAAVGMVALDADTAQRWAEDGTRVILVRPETKPDDVHGMLAAQGLLTSRGGRTSHAALVARQFGKPAVVGVEDMMLDMDARVVRFADGTQVAERDWLSLDGTSGVVYLGSLDTVVPDLNDAHLMRLLQWADEFRTLDVRANADYPDDAARAREYGATGIGLCRTEHMFFETDRLPLVRQMIMAGSPSESDDAILQLLPLQRADFEGLFEAMDGHPVIIRLLDPPLHEFLPSWDELVHDLGDLKIRSQHARDLAELDGLLEAIRERQRFLHQVEELREQNPMLGNRGVRLGLQLPNLIRMQVRAIIEAACACARRDVEVHPEIMIPLVGHLNEVTRVREVLEEEARRVMEEQGMDVPYRFGTMIEVPRAALVAGEIAAQAEFFSFGTNDLTQMTFGISRDDAESGFLLEYQRQGIMPENPFHSLDRDGVGALMRMAVEAGRARRPGLEVGICGEHGGDPRSIALCHELGLDYVSCSPFRVPIARLAAAQVALAEREEEREAVALEAKGATGP